jgi:hypothetical protein
MRARLNVRSGFVRSRFEWTEEIYPCRTSKAEMRKPLSSKLCTTSERGPVKLCTSRFTVTGLVVLHFAIVVAHGVAHRQMEIGLETWQQAFVAVAILVGPLMAVVVLWTSWKKLGAIMLAVCMFGASAFGIFYHFLFPSADSIFFLKTSGWDDWFAITAVLLATIETTCFVWCVWILRHRSLA